MIEIINLSFWFVVACYLMYERLRKLVKTWDDYAEMGVIVIIFLLFAFITFISLLS